MVSGTVRKLAVAPPTVTDLTTALELMRNVKDVPVPRPTLVALRIATRSRFARPVARWR